MIVTNDHTSSMSAPPTQSSPSSVIRSNGLLDQQEAKFKGVGIPRRRIPQTEIKQNIPPPSENSKNLRRIRSDNLDESKRDDPSVRRSIFGHYFKEKPRSHSAPHLEPLQPPPPIPIWQQQTTTRSYKRSSCSSRGSIPPLPPTSEKSSNHRDHDGSRRLLIHDHPSNPAQSVDYRVFAPSEQQVADSAICSRYRELNREHQKDYDSLLERQVQVEHSLPPFPSPLVRFCSDTTAVVAEHDEYSSQNKHPESKSYFSSPDGEMHYHGVYSLLKPCSILRPSRYCPNKTTSIIVSEASNRSLLPTLYSNNAITTQSEKEDMNHNLSTPLSSSFNFPRSYIETSAILNQFEDSGSIFDSGADGEEEKKESDHAFTSVPTAPDTPLLPKNIINELSSSNKNISGIASNIEMAGNDGCHNDSQDKSEVLQGLHQNNQHLRFDPRVTVTEFEDPVPRKWYQDSELEVQKREAISLAQSYLRKHPAIAVWYRRANLDPVTKTYRKRALFSLPVFSSTYTDIDSVPSPEIIAHNNDFNSLEEGLTKTTPGISSPTLRSKKSSTPSVKKILVVHPNPKIASLFCKSMKSMFPSAQLVSARTSEEASQLIRQSFAPSNNGSPLSSLFSSGTASSYDIIIVWQHLTHQSSSSPKASKLDEVLKNPLGFLDILMKKPEEEPTPPASPTGNGTRRGSDLIHLVNELSSCNHRRPSSLLIGVSVRPDRDAPLMKRAGADIVWGIPIPKVGDALRNKLFSVLLAKRS